MVAYSNFILRPSEILERWSGLELPDGEFGNSASLQEGIVVGLSFDAVENRLGLLFDMRQNAWWGHDVGVVVATNVSVISWSTRPLPWRFAWSLGDEGTLVRTPNERGTWKCAISGGGMVSATFESMTLLVGDMVQLSEVPADYTDATEEEVRTSNPRWDYLFALRAPPILMWPSGSS